MSNWGSVLDLEDAVNKFNEHYKKYFPCGIELSETVVHIHSVNDNRFYIISQTVQDKCSKCPSYESEFLVACNHITVRRCRGHIYIYCDNLVDTIVNVAKMKERLKGIDLSNLGKHVKLVDSSQSS